MTEEQVKEESLWVGPPFGVQSEADFVKLAERFQELRDEESSAERDHEVCLFLANVMQWTMDLLPNRTITEVNRWRRRFRQERSCKENLQTKLAQNEELYNQAEAQVTELQEKINEYEQKPWPGCRIMSLGDKCTCSLCEADKKLKAMQEKSNELLACVRWYLQDVSGDKITKIMTAFKSRSGEKIESDMARVEKLRERWGNNLLSSKPVALPDDEEFWNIVFDWMLTITQVEALSKLLEKRREDFINLNDAGYTIIDFQNVWLNQKDSQIAKLEAQIKSMTETIELHKESEKIWIRTAIAFLDMLDSGKVDKERLERFVSLSGMLRSHREARKEIKQGDQTDGVQQSGEGSDSPDPGAN